MMNTNVNYELDMVNNTNQMALLSLMEEEGNNVSEFIYASKSENTVISYTTDWNKFTEWCASKNIMIGHVGNQFIPVTPQLVCIYISYLAKQGYKFSSIKRKVTSITVAHNSAGAFAPTKDFTVKETLKGIGNTTKREVEKKDALIGEDIAEMVSHCDDSVIGIRDKALLLIGFFLGSRRSEIVNVDMEHITFMDDRIIIKVEQDKTHDINTKHIIASGTSNCPVQALKNWLTVSGITEGAVFRSIDRYGNTRKRLTDKTVYNTVKKYAEMAGLDPKQYGAHSLRSGFATHAINNGWTETDVQQHLGHKHDTQTKGYIRDAKRKGKNYTVLSI